MNGTADWTLGPLLDVAGVRHAVVLSGDGLPIATSPDVCRAARDRIAAACSGLQSLAHGVMHEFGFFGPAMRQVMIEFDGGFLFLAAAGHGAHLGVIADATVDAGLVGHQMQVVVATLGDHLSSPPRETVR